MRWKAHVKGEDVFLYAVAPAYREKDNGLPCDVRSVA